MSFLACIEYPIGGRRRRHRLLHLRCPCGRLARYAVHDGRAGHWEQVGLACEDCSNEAAMAQQRIEDEAEKGARP